MRDETLYHQYANFKLENDELFTFLKQRDSLLLFRMQHIMEVTDHYYDKLIDDPNFTDEEDEIFKAGFMYLENVVAELKTILEKYYQNNLIDLDKDAKVVGLVLNAIEFQNELLRIEDFDAKDMQFLLDFEQSILAKIQNKEVIDEASFQQLDENSDRIFKKFPDFYPLNHIFLDIAADLDLV